MDKMTICADNAEKKICADNAEKKICADNAEKMAVYADNAATTRMSDAALSAMLPYLKEEYGNPSSLYAFGQRAKEELEKVRAFVAAAFRCEPREIYFTSGGTESDNWAILGAAYAQRNEGNLFYLGRKRGGQPGAFVVGGAGRKKGEKAYYFHGLRASRHTAYFAKIEIAGL